MDGLDENDMEQINALAAVIVAKVLDELEPESETTSASNLALGALACTAARAQLQAAALGA